MTLITFSGGGPILRSGMVGTEQACCCCSGPCSEENPCPDGCYCCDGQCQQQSCWGCCCVGGVIDVTKTTQAQCQDAGGIWHAGTPCSDSPCGCDEYQWGFGGCTSANCEADITAFLEAAGYVPRFTFAGSQDGCGQRWLISIVGVCCGTIGGDCGTMTTQVRCVGPCGSDPPNCPDPQATVDATIPVCCNLFP